MLVVGIIERDGGTLYCTVVFFDNEGTYLGKHRKLMPTGSERLVWGFGDGSTLPVFDTDYSEQPCTKKASKYIVHQLLTIVILG